MRRPASLAQQVPDLAPGRCRSGRRRRRRARRRRSAGGGAASRIAPLEHARLGALDVDLDQRRHVVVGQRGVERSIRTRIASPSRCDVADGGLVGQALRIGSAARNVNVRLARLVGHGRVVHLDAREVALQRLGELRHAARTRCGVPAARTGPSRAARRPRGRRCRRSWRRPTAQAAMIARSWRSSRSDRARRSGRRRRRRAAAAARCRRRGRSGGPAGGPSAGSASAGS